MRSLCIATVAVAALLPASAAAQAHSSANSNAGTTFSQASAGRGGAFSHAQSGPVVRPMPPQGGWSGGRPQQPRPPMTMPNRPRPGNWSGGTWSGGRPPVVRPGNGGHSRWGGRIDGRWHSGWQAPGGWNAYRRPYRGWALPSYWFAPTYFIGDYGYYGLGAPPAGYNWSRYYDDAVLIDGRGRVYDSVSGLDWDRYEGGYAYDDSYDDGERYYADGVDDDYGPRGRDARNGGRGRRDSGVGGAVIGGVLGGVAGNAIAGRGDKLAGTLIGAGAGAVVGTAIDRAEDRGNDSRRDDRRGPPPPPYADSGAPYGYPDRGPPPPPGYAPGPGNPRVIVQLHGGYMPGPGYPPVHVQNYGNGAYSYYYNYAYGGGTTTTVTYMPTTTTTTETITVYDTQRATKWRAPVKRTKILRRTPSKILYRTPSKTLQR